MTTIQFWSNDPTLLLNKEYIFEFWPSKDMCYEQKLNAITRLIILISILGYVLTRSTRILLVGFLTVLAIFTYFKIRNGKEKEKDNEGFMVIGDNVYGLYDNKKNMSTENSRENYRLC